MKDRITGIIERWFIQEPALFQVLCSHELAENATFPSSTCACVSFV